ncbi:S1/P1 nuclease [Pedobacter sp. SD-b]|uniref:S1/P1 nuclease n=1 Tax=Pedobacter segetis TaxID=2793069 RepID=A0ABS1BHH9_9SPHI|nr:S1/P1 nuclease [Pedobacter segetis]MBK0382340.1 S1/P1 nuclease [Pedobacter segetis]
MRSRFFYPSLAILFAFSLISWGVVGHRTIAKIAENHLTPRAKAVVQQLLGAEDMPIVSTFSDEIRYSNEYKETGPWHYLNLPQGLSYQDFVTRLKSDSSENVYNALLKMEKQLTNPNSTKEEKTFALKMVIHLVGDLHQPMHISRAEDLGGNKIDIRFQGKPTNLHSLWDSGLIDYNGMTFTEMATAYDNVSDEKIKEWQADDLTKWLYESYEISTKLYEEVAENPNLDYTYYPKHSQIYKERIQKAGIRLAGLLNTLLK